MSSSAIGWVRMTLGSHRPSTPSVGTRDAGVSSLLIDLEEDKVARAAAFVLVAEMESDVATAAPR